MPQAIRYAKAMKAPFAFSSNGDSFVFHDMETGIEIKDIDMILSQRAQGTIRDTIKIAQLDPSLSGSLQSLAVPTFGSNEEGAYAFMDYMLSSAAQEILVKDMAAIPLIDTSDMDMTGCEDLMGLDVSNFRILSIGDLSTDFNQRWDNEIGTIG